MAQTCRSDPAGFMAAFIVAVAVACGGPAAAQEAPPVTDDLQLWLEAGTGATYDLNGYVSAWEDLANSYDAAQSDANRKPVWMDAQINGLPAIRFTGNSSNTTDDDSLDGPAVITGDIARTIIMVVRSNQSPGMESMMELNRGTTSAGVLYRMTPELAARYNSGNTVFANNPVDNAFRIVVFQNPAGATSSNTSAYLDGVRATATSETVRNINTGSAGYRLGDGNSLGASGFSGDIAEVLVYDTALSQADLNAVGKHLEDKYALKTSYVPEANLSNPIKVFLLAGQSNMVGQGVASERPAPLDKAQGDVMFWHGGGTGWELLDTGTGTNGGFGPELKFGRDIADAFPDERIAVIKYAVGGTDLAEDWNPDPGDMGPQYSTFLTTAHAALQSLTDAGQAYEIVGMCWMQGEADSKVQTMADAYRVNLTNFIESVREEFDAPDMSFIIGRPTPNLPDSTFPYKQTVRDAMAYNVDSMGLTDLVDTDDLPVKSDNVHFGTTGQLGLGERFAALSLKAQSLETVSNDLNAAGDFTNNFTLVTGQDPGATMTEQNGIGLGGTRALLPSPDRVTGIYNSSFDLFHESNYVMMSLFIQKTADNDTANEIPFIGGLMAGNTQPLEPVATNWVGLRLQAKKSDGTTNWVWDYFRREGGASTTGDLQTADLVNGNWYRFVVKIRNEGEGDVGLWGVLEDWGADGERMVGTVFYTDWTTLASSLAGDPTVYAAFRANIDGGAAAVDDIYLEAYDVPEPATLALLALGGIALLRRRQRA